jgi:hypothetical protein
MSSSSQNFLFFIQHPKIGPCNGRTLVSLEAGSEFNVISIIFLLLRVKDSVQWLNVVITAMIFHNSPKIFDKYSESRNKTSMIDSNPCRIYRLDKTVEICDDIPQR